MTVGVITLLSTGETDADLLYLDSHLTPQHAIENNDLRAKSRHRSCELVAFSDDV